MRQFVSHALTCAQWIVHVQKREGVWKKISDFIKNLATNAVAKSLVTHFAKILRLEQLYIVIENRNNFSK